MSDDQVAYIQEKVADNWMPDIIIGKAEKEIGSSMRTLYHRSKESDLFEVTVLPIKGKRNPTVIKKNMGNKPLDANSKTVERNTLITLVDRLSKIIITLKPDGRKTKDFWLAHLPLR